MSTRARVISLTMLVLVFVVAAFVVSGTATSHTTRNVTASNYQTHTGTAHVGRDGDVCIGHVCAPVVGSQPFTLRGAQVYGLYDVHARMWVTILPKHGEIPATTTP